MHSITLKTFAKINLSLDVTGARSDGYHDVRMVMQGIDLWDEITVSLTPLPASDGAEESAFTSADSAPVNIILTVDKAGIPTDSKNTAYAAARVIAEEYQFAVKNTIKTVSCGQKTAGLTVNIDIHKNIPAAAGLAGGSSDAAGVLLALNSLMKLGLPLRELCRLGRRVGADVPFCVMSAAGKNPASESEVGAFCAIAEGTGEILTPIPSVSAWVVLAKPELSVSTAHVYKALDSIENPYPHPDTGLVVEGIRTANLRKIKQGMANVLENVTLAEYPEVGELKALMLRCCSGAAMMSGSGPVVFSLFETEGAARRACSRLEKELYGKNFDVFCTKTL